MTQDLHRSEEPIEEADLLRLADLAQTALTSLVKRNTDRSGIYRDRAFLICLCKRAAFGLGRLPGLLSTGGLGKAGEAVRVG